MSSSATTAGPPSKPGYETPKGCNALVTGSCGFVGSRLVEMLLERGARTVIAFDLKAPDDVLQARFEAIQEKTGSKIIVLSGSEGDLCSDTAVDACFTKVGQVDVVFHIAALVGPFHSKELYDQVNYQGTLRIIEGCKKYKVPKLVYSSSPSTRFTGGEWSVLLLLLSSLFVWRGVILWVGVCVVWSFTIIVSQIQSQPCTLRFTV